MYFTLLREEVPPEVVPPEEVPPEVEETQIEESQWATPTTVPGFPEQTAPAVAAPAVPSATDMLPPPAPEKSGIPVVAVQEYTSTTCRKQWNLLSRVANGPRATHFPELSKLFNGTKENKLTALRNFMANNESLEATEAGFRFERQQSQTLTKSRKCLTITQMRQEGCSEFFACYFFQAILSSHEILRIMYLCLS